MDYYYTICFLSLIYILEALYDIPLTMITTCTSPSFFLRYPIIPLHRMEVQSFLVSIGKAGNITVPQPTILKLTIFHVAPLPPSGTKLRRTGMLPAGRYTQHGTVALTLRKVN
jgi:hypothetical protein